MTLPAPTNVDIQRVVDLVVATAQPLRIVLFGSAARGELRPGSDLDIMIVMPEGTDTLRTAQTLHAARMKAGITNVPVDFVVVTPDEYEMHRRSIGLVYREIERDGRDVYVA